MVTLALGASVARVQGNDAQGAVLDLKVRPSGVSPLTVTSVATDGPLLLTMMVNITSVPAVVWSGPVCPTARSASVATVVVAVALLFAATGSGVSPGGVTVAVLSSVVTVASGATVPVAVKVAEPPACRSTSASMFPVPPAGQLAPPAALQVHSTPESSPGKVSVTRAAVTAVGPALATVIV